MLDLSEVRRITGHAEMLRMLAERLVLLASMRGPHAEALRSEVAEELLAECRDVVKWGQPT